MLIRKLQISDYARLRVPSPTGARSPGPSCLGTGDWVLKRYVCDDKRNIGGDIGETCLFKRPSLKFQKNITALNCDVLLQTLQPAYPKSANSRRQCFPHLLSFTVISLFEGPFTSWFDLQATVCGLGWGSRRSPRRDFCMTSLTPLTSHVHPNRTTFRQ